LKSTNINSVLDRNTGPLDFQPSQLNFFVLIRLRLGVSFWLMACHREYW